MPAGSGDESRDRSYYCGGKTRAGGRCKNRAGKGTDHVGIGSCKLHGGCTRNHRKSAQAEIARRAVVKYGLPREIEPHDALLEEVYRSAGTVAYIDLKVQEIKESGDALTQSPWIDLYHRERSKLVDVCKTALAAGIAERQVKLAESQGQLIAQVIRGVLVDLGVDLEQPDVPKIVRHHLTLVQGGKS